MCNIQTQKLPVRSVQTIFVIQVAAYCYQGQCQSHQSQCQLLWGSSSDMSVRLCYSCFNTDGSFAGNCGVNLNNLTYVSCATRSVTHFTSLNVNYCASQFEVFSEYSFQYFNPIRRIGTLLTISH